jgi:hypothetical protein
MPSWNPQWLSVKEFLVQVGGNRKKKHKISMTFSLQKGEQEDQKSFTGKDIL